MIPRINTSRVISAAKHDNSGSAIVEAVFIYPIIVFSAVTLLYMAICLFQSVCIVTGMSGALSAASGRITSTVCYGDEFQRELLYLGTGRAQTESVILEEFNERVGSIPVRVYSENTEAKLDRGLVFDEISISADKLISAEGIVPFRRNRKYYAAASVVDEADWIRSSDLIIGG